MSRMATRTLAAGALFVVFAVALVALSALSGRTSLLQTKSMDASAGLKATEQKKTALSPTQIIKAWAKDPSLREVMKHALRKHGAKTVRKFVSKLGHGLDSEHHDGESMDQVEDDLKIAGMKAEKVDIAYEAICHQEMADFQNEMSMASPDHPPPGEKAEDWNLKIAAGVLFTHIDKDESGCIEPHEFEDFVHDLQKELPEEVCKVEMHQLCKDLEDDHGHPDPHKIDEKFMEVDEDGSGYLSLNEVTELMHTILLANGIH